MAGQGDDAILHGRPDGRRVHAGLPPEFRLHRLFDGEIAHDASSRCAWRVVADAGTTMRPRWWDWVSLMALSITSFPVSLVRGGPRRGVVGFTPITLPHSFSETESGMR